MLSQDKVGSTPGLHAPVADSRPDREQKPYRVIINADDWGATPLATDRILECIRQRVVSSTSAMVFMGDSERAATLARENSVDAGLHLNLTQPFTSSSVPANLREHHARIARFLHGGTWRYLIFNPLLTRSFDYVVKAQLEKFQRLYGVPPRRIDGHHHTHLCANVQRQKLLPAGTILRRNFTFAPGEKGWANRTIRMRQDRRLALRHPIADYFFDLLPLDPERLRRILEFARASDIEIETHPEREAEYKFLLDHSLENLGLPVEILNGYFLRNSAETRTRESVASSAPQTPPSHSVQQQGAIPHICVCICTYKRPAELTRLLRELQRQNTAGQFTWSVVVADNDPARSGEAAVLEARQSMNVPVRYCAEPERGIARARNRVIANAQGDYYALIDDDEFPEPDWLLNLLRTCREYNVDGVLGPVKRYLEPNAPAWLKRSTLYDRPVHPTGLPVVWNGARTGNALLKREVFEGSEPPFRVEFISGEDQDFFRRKIEEGRSFVWSSDAVAHEVLPPARWKRMYFVKKAFLFGSHAAMQPNCGAKSIAKSLIAVPLYALALPFALAAGQHRFMTLLVKLCEHAGKLLALVHIRPVHGEYVSD